MTDEQKKEMLNGIINNGEKWECRATPNGIIELPICYYTWQPYKLGDEIRDDWEYRKVENWVVFQWYKSGKYHLYCTENLNDNYDYIIVFEGTKEDCETYIKEHTKKTWLEECLDDDIDNMEHNLGFKNGAKEVCKKILEEVISKIAEKQVLGFTFSQIDSEELKEIIKDLGVPID